MHRTDTVMSRRLTALAAPLALAVLLAGCSSGGEQPAAYTPPVGGGLTPSGTATAPPTPGTAKPKNPSSTSSSHAAGDGHDHGDLVGTHDSTIDPKLRNEEHPVVDKSSQERYVTGSGTWVAETVLRAMLTSSHTDPYPRAKLTSVRQHVTDAMWTYLGGQRIGTFESAGEKASWQRIKTKQLTVSADIESAGPSGMGVQPGQYPVELAYTTRSQEPDGIGRPSDVQYVTMLLVRSAGTYKVDKIIRN